MKETLEKGVWNMFKVKSNDTCNKKYFVNTEHVSRLFLVFLFLKFSRYMFAEVIAHKKNKTDLTQICFL